MPPKRKQDNQSGPSESLADRVRRRRRQQARERSIVRGVQSTQLHGGRGRGRDSTSRKHLMDWGKLEVHRPAIDAEHDRLSTMNWTILRRINTFSPQMRQRMDAIVQQNIRKMNKLKNAFKNPGNWLWDDESKDMHPRNPPPPPPPPPAGGGIGIMA